MQDADLRINDVTELVGISRRSIYNAINSGKLSFITKTVDGKPVKLFSIESVIWAFPKMSDAHKTVLRQNKEIERLQFANLKLLEAIERLDPNATITMTKI